MQYLLAQLLKILAYSLSLLPFRILYILSDLLYLLTYHVVKYRKEVVYRNLRNAFPGKSEEALRQMAKRYYRHLCDLVVESIKMLSISRQTLLRHFRFKNLDLLDRYYANGKSLIGVVGHYGNWELGGLALSARAKHKVLSVYKPFSNKYFDRLMYKVRSRFGAELVPMKKTGRALVAHKNQPTITMLITDQTPSNPTAAHWTTFLNQETLVFLGTEKLAQKFDYPVIYCHIRKKERGLYETTFTPLFDHPKKTEAYCITEKHTQMLERSIREAPPYWLWSHKRWKHKRKDHNTHTSANKTDN